MVGNYQAFLCILGLFSAQIPLSASYKRVPQHGQAESDGTDPIECKDETGKGVPWFIAYKLPKLRSSSRSTFREGRGYSYLLPGYKAWRSSEKPISALDSLVGQSIRPLILSNPGILQILYNDQPPDRPAFSGNAHSKGVVLANGRGGLWLFHSVPRFPDVDRTNFYPSNGLVNAQMFLCLSLRTATELDSIADIFTITRPNIGNTTVPKTLQQMYPKLDKFLATKRFRGGGLNTTSTLTSGQYKFLVFAKSPKFSKEIFMDWLAPTLSSDLEVQSWRAGQGILNSSCSSHSFQVMNIDEKRIDAEDFSRNDHSKWVVTPSGTESSWVCISDLNRMGQASRGGATVCTSNKPLWNAFNSAVMDLEPCEVRSKQTKMG